MPAFAALILYALLRAQSGAFTLDNAPVFYRFTSNPLSVWMNIVQYVDRSATFPLAVLVMLAIFTRTTPELSRDHLNVILKGVAWWVAGFAITVWLPVRSSLYAVWPSIGVALIVGVIADGSFAKAGHSRLRRMAIATAILPFLLLPVYWSRNVRWVELADLSTATFRAIDADSRTLSDGTLIELIDDRSTRANFANVFGALYAEAAHFYFKGRHQLWIEPPPPEVVASALAKPQMPTAAVFELRHTHVTRVR